MDDAVNVRGVSLHVSFDCVATAEPVALLTRAVQVVAQCREASEVQARGIATTLQAAPASIVSRSVTTCRVDVVAT
jgi:hypothetical protein